MSPAEIPEHADAEALALHALGEDVGAEVTEHLAACPQCLAALAQLSATVEVGRSTVAGERLAEPAPRVWAAIRNELNLDADGAEADALGTHSGAPTGASPSSSPGVATPAKPRRMRILAFGLAAALVGVLAVGGAAVWIAGSSGPRTLATAVLDPLPDWGQASGTAVLEESEDGTRDVRVTLDAAVPADGYREVWLLTRDADELVSLGVLDGRTGSFTVPDGVDLTAYDIVDISQEALDGDPAHSGTSIVRGSLAEPAV